jgi:hypothetical protein
MKKKLIGYMVLTIFILMLNPHPAEAAGKVKVKPAETTVIEFQNTAKELYKAALPILIKLEYKIDSKKKRKYIRAINNDVKIFSIIASKDGKSSWVGDGILYQKSVNIWLEEIVKGTTRVSIYASLEEFKLKYPNDPVSVKKKRELEKEKEVVTKLKEVIKIL